MLRLSYNENGLTTASLSYKLNAVLRGLKARPSVISIVSMFDKDRAEVEQFIKDIYQRSYGARINVHYPVLMSVRDESGRILAAAGFRSAAESPLFLEQYLDQRAETILQTPRDHIVEVGNLASDGGGATLYLFTALSAYLLHKGFLHLMLTSTHTLEARFRKMGLNPKRHVPADPDLLLQRDEDWGSYYDTKPFVISGDLRASYRRLQRLLGAQYLDHRPRLFPRLHYK